METRIIFNGKTYTQVEDMPPDVRQAYEQAMAQFADRNKNGIPDIFEGRTQDNVVAIQQSSITFNGREYKSTGEMPPMVRRLFEMVLGQADANRNGIPDALEAAAGINVTYSSTPKEGSTPANTPDASTSKPDAVLDPVIKVLGQSASALDIVLRNFLALVSIATIAGAIFLMIKIDASSRNQGGRFYIALAALVILGIVDSQFRKLVERRAPLTLGTSEVERRYAMVSLLLLVGAAFLLFGLAFFLP
jgi:hypothetical protein